MSSVLVLGGEGAELPAALETPWVSNTGTVLLSSLVAVLTTLGVLVRGRCPPIAEVSSGEVLSGADGEPVSNGFTEDRVVPLPPPPWVPKEDWEWPGGLMSSVPGVETSVVWARVVLAGRDLNVLPPPLVPAVEMEVLVVRRLFLLSVDTMLNDTWLLPVAGEGPSKEEPECVRREPATSVKSVIPVDP